MTAQPLWTADEVLEATGGRLDGQGFEAQGVTFDSREVQPGDIFVALAGERDGHDFASMAFEKGAAAAIVSRPVEGGSSILVPDTLKALEALGAYARDRAPQVRRGAVTGSVGKTSVTQAIRAGLTLAGPAHSSIKSFNNHIGVPLTLARMPRDVERAVFEIGMNHADEIRPLSKMVQPHAACVTTVGPVHTENFPDGEAGVARAKAEIFEGLGPGGVAIVNADNVWFDLLKQSALHVGARVMTFGVDESADACLLDFKAFDGGARVRARVWGHEHDFTLRQSGHHWGLNSMAVLLMLDALDVSVETGIAALSEFEPLAGRGQEKRVRVEGGVFTLVDESYNANPLSMRAAFRSLGAREVGEGRRIVVATDMLELGTEAADHHASLAGPLAEANVDLVFCAGPNMKHLWSALPESRRGAWAETAAELAPKVVEAVKAGDVVVVKGSNGSRAGLVAKALADIEVAGREMA
ncbi:UDP-N-acetylmuramoyl-tripeptide--D-alanyl-D-alanine ligase [Caulobacter sp. 17J80-11]|uniref:UDP-N-acetylmuramoyl-tripeptide--D-alanyl-D- alanine ligase n=1 Tax=Caulobacter sp. 17J80-11 TaxID=2763502 RepID=UPI001653970E|nr:UDP-N-acetylmuramoyl-tripeptide--D-alanyl-D-alanine ligase [Caulobacter sp. 17J80-11]MBC6980570.1 UDP-N-acetylmuramoyl-tripeptide--D-alanyl-D-alanine ligase [Caulobacter sp. 17J80-11]